MSKKGSSARIIIAEHDRDVRQAVQLVCEERLGMQVIAAVIDYGELINFAKSEKPDGIVVEWTLLGIHPQVLMTELRQAHDMKIVVMGTHAELRSEAMASGADAFMYKGDSPDALLNVLRNINADWQSKKQGKDSLG